MKTKVLTAFTRQLATLVDAGLPLLRGLRVLEKQEKSPVLKDAINQISFSIEGGSTFSEGLAQHPKIFNKLFVNMVRAGEAGGVLDKVLDRLAKFREKAERIIAGIAGARLITIPGAGHSSPVEQPGAVTAAVTVSAAALLVAEPALFVTTTV